MQKATDTMDKARLKELREKLNLAFAEAGEDMDLTKVKCLKGETESEKLEEIREINNELEDFNRQIALAKGHDHSGHPLPGGFNALAGGKSKAKGWKDGYWSTPFLKGMEIGTKGLISSGTITVPTLTGGIVPIADRPISILELIPTEGLQETDTYAYLREETREHKAAPTAKSTLKPSSVYKVKKIEGTARTIAHVSEPVARQDLEDEKLLADYINGSMAAGVQQALEAEILSGKGEGQELPGIAKTSGIQEQAFSENILDSARAALTKLENKQIPAGVFVLSTAHWQKIETLRTEDGIYIGGAPGTLPVDRMRKQLWGMPVVTTTLLSGKLGYLVDFPGSTKLWERTGVRIDWSEAPDGSVEKKAGFLSNELTFRGEGRYGFGVTRPAGVVQVGLEA
jgi:HK97 family phage major capsid protein